jgi:hypothetical protein
MKAVSDNGTVLNKDTSRLSSGAVDTTNQVAVLLLRAGGTSAMVVIV